MGMFDCIRCEYPLPVAGAQDYEYQTKDTPNQHMDTYTITADGRLLVEEYDEPKKPRTEVILTGEVRFYDYGKDRRWLEFSAYFVRGLLKELHLIRDDLLPEPVASPSLQYLAKEAKCGS